MFFREAHLNRPNIGSNPPHASCSLTFLEMSGPKQPPHWHPRRLEAFKQIMDSLFFVFFKADFSMEIVLGFIYCSRNSYFMILSKCDVIIPKHSMYALGGQNPEKWRFWSLEIWLLSYITPKTEGCGFPWWFIYLTKLSSLSTAVSGSLNRW